MKLCFFTSINNAYFGKARVLAKSIKEAHPDSVFVVGLLDNIHHDQQSIEPAFDRYLYAGDIFVGDFDRWIFTHDVVEACTAQKGLIMDHLLTSGEFDAVIYLDPDIKVYSTLHELVDVLHHDSVVVTPHLGEPARSIQHIRDNELSTLIHGVFNLGFLAVKNDASGRRFADWWKERLLQFCYDEKSLGLFTDQKWIDLAPAYFDFVKVLRHPGYNIATWNIENRIFSRDENGKLLVNEQEVRFIHFSGFDSGAHVRAIEKYAADQPIFGELSASYTVELDRNSVVSIETQPWRFSQNRFGEKIQPSWRRRYRDDLVLRDANPDPYCLGGERFERGFQLDPLSTYVIRERPSIWSCLELAAKSLSNDGVGLADSENINRLIRQLNLFRKQSVSRVCFITHGLGGGTDMHVKELARFVGGGVQVIVAAAKQVGETKHEVSLSILSEFGESICALELEINEDELTFVLASLEIEHFHVHHIMGGESLWPRLLSSGGKRYTLTVHDYFLLTENWSMISTDGTLLSIPEQEDEIARDAIVRPERRRRAEQLVRGATEVIFPSRDTWERFRTQLSVSQTVIAPHPEVPRPELLAVEPEPLTDNRIRIAVIGDFGPHKGSAQVNDFARLVHSRGLEIEVHHFGPTCYAIRPNVIEHGPFHRSIIPFQLRASGIHLVWIPSQVHETYSYVLSDVMKSRLPVVVSKVGALPERIAGRTHSSVVDSNAGPEEILSCIQRLLFSPITNHEAQAPNALYVDNSYYESYRERLKGAGINGD